MSIVIGPGSGALAEVVVERGVEEARLRGAPLVLVRHVSLPRRETDPGVYQTHRRRVEEDARAAAAEIAARGVRCEAYVPPTPGRLAEAVLSAADELDARLIVVGIPRRSPVGKAVLGSDAQDIVLGARCPVLGVKLPEDREGGR